MMDGGPGVAGGCRVGLVIALALARAALLPVSRATVAPQPTAYPALGDSLAVGTEARQPEWLGYVPRLSRTVRRPADAERLQSYARAGETSAAFRTGGHLAQAVAAISDPTTDVRLVTLDIGGDDLLALLQGPGARSGGVGPRRRGR
jgi:lysophospholipase L1-like esterase